MNEHSSNTFQKLAQTKIEKLKEKEEQKKVKRKHDADDDVVEVPPAEASPRQKKVHSSFNAKTHI